MLPQLVRFARRNARLIASLLFLAVVCIGTDVLATEGNEGTFEFAIDAPWRIEPHFVRQSAGGAIGQPGGLVPTYGRIPIQITIHDADFAFEDCDARVCGHADTAARNPACNKGQGCHKNLSTLGMFQAVSVKEYLSDGSCNEKEFRLEDLDEIELTIGHWLGPNDPSGPVHHICRQWANEDCSNFAGVDFANIGSTNEWHAVLWYQPCDPAPDSYVDLDVVVELVGQTPMPWEEDVANYFCGGCIEGDACSPGDSDYVFPASPGNNQYLGCNDPRTPDMADLLEDIPITLKSHLVVYLSNYQLPRFGDGWIYGDLHYHSQGTDNEGESAYNYRGVIRAIGALGLDFVFATDHASDSWQITDTDITLDLFDENPGLGTLWDYFIGNCDGLDCLEWDPECMDFSTSAFILRDMSPYRFAFCHDLIYGAGGVNGEAAYRAGARFPQSYLSRRVVPQMFLGGEVDVIPEAKLTDPNTEGRPACDDYSIAGPPVRLRDLCTTHLKLNCGVIGDSDASDRCNEVCADLDDVTEQERCEMERNESCLLDLCELEDILEPRPEEGVCLLKDSQGTRFLDYGREHLVYLPGSASNRRFLCRRGHLVDYLDPVCPPEGVDPFDFGDGSQAGSHGPCGDRTPVYEFEEQTISCDECMPSEPTIVCRTESDTRFVSSSTGTWGSAQRRLRDVLGEVESKGGYLFAAHPFNNAGTPAPDGVPWTIPMLEEAFASQAWLGLQFWNEDNRLKRTISVADGQEGFDREGSTLPDWERALTPVTALAGKDFGFAFPSNELRSGFGLSGGPNSERTWSFRLDPFGERLDGKAPVWNVREGVDPGPLDLACSLAESLAKGEVAWDMMIRWGLDLERTANLNWLNPNEPRRVFMAGGSDAHGDLNYRREGYFVHLTAVTDTAIGKPRNLVHVRPRPIAPLPPPLGKESVRAQTQDDVVPVIPVVPVFPPVIPVVPVFPPGTPETPVPSPTPIPPIDVDPLPLPIDPVPDPEPNAPLPEPAAECRAECITDADTSQSPPAPTDAIRYSQEEIIDALRKGRFAVTDGPALRIAIDWNGNCEPDSDCTIDDEDTQMGEVLYLDAPIDHLTVLVEYKSTPEFGAVRCIEVVVVSPRAGSPDSDGLIFGPTTCTGDSPIRSRLFSSCSTCQETTCQLKPDASGDSYEGVHPVTFSVEDLNRAFPPRFWPAGRLAFRARAITWPKERSDKCTVATSTEMLRGDCVERLAYTNPIWVVGPGPREPVVPSFVPPRACGLGMLPVLGLSGALCLAWRGRSRNS